MKSINYFWNAAAAGGDCYFLKQVQQGLREEKEIFGANNRDMVSVHQNGCKTGVLLAFHERSILKLTKERR